MREKKGKKLCRVWVHLRLLFQGGASASFFTPQQDTWLNFSSYQLVFKVLSYLKCAQLFKSPNYFWKVANHSFLSRFVWYLIIHYLLRTTKEPCSKSSRWKVYNLQTCFPFFFLLNPRPREKTPGFYRGRKDYFLLLTCRRFCTLVHPYSVKFVKWGNNTRRFFSGPVHRFKKLCEKLQVILLSNQRKSTSNGRECEETQDDRIPDHEREHAPDNSKLQLAHLTDTESEGEVLDSPRGTGRKLSLSQVNGKEAVYYTQVWKMVMG